MEKKELIAVIVILAVLVAGLGGYIVYDKVLITAEKNENVTENKEKNKEKEQQEGNDSNNELESEENTAINDNSQSQSRTPRCTGTYYGAQSATETYKYVLNTDGTFTAEFGGVSGTSGVYVINDNTISLIGKKDVVGPRNQDPYYNTEDYVIADDCSYITVTKGSATFGLNKQ